MIRVRVLGRGGTRRQCASMLRRALTGAVVAAAVLASAAGARGPVTTDEPGSIGAAFQQRSYPPGERADLRLWPGVPPGIAPFFHARPERPRSARDDGPGGVPGGAAVPLAAALAR